MSPRTVYSENKSVLFACNVGTKRMIMAIFIQLFSQSPGSEKMTVSTMHRLLEYAGRHFYSVIREYQKPTRLFLQILSLQSLQIPYQCSSQKTSLPNSSRPLSRFQSLKTGRLRILSSHTARSTSLHIAATLSTEWSKISS